MVNTSPITGPRHELAAAIVEGEGAVKDLIGEKILPPFPINYRTAHAAKVLLSGSQAMRTIDSDKFVRSPGTKFERVVATISDVNIDVTLRAVEIVVPIEANMDYKGILDLESMFASKFGMETSAFTKEKLIAAQIFSTGNFGSATNSGVAYTAANIAGATPFDFFSDVILSIRRVKARGERPNTVAMSGPVYERIRQNTRTKEYVVGQIGPVAEVTSTSIQQALAEFGITQVLIGDAYVNNAQDGATPSLGQIWSNTYIWVGRSGAVTASETDGVIVPSMGGVGANVYWEQYQTGGLPSTDLKATTFDGGNYVETYPSKEIDASVIRLKMSHKPFMGNTRAGDLIATQYS